VADDRRQNPGRYAKHKKNGNGSSVIVLPEGKFFISDGMVIAAFSLFNPSQLVDSRKEKGRVCAYKIGNEE
jgi:hypothetical protein